MPHNLEALDCEPASGARIGVEKARAIGREFIDIDNRRGTTDPHVVQEEVNAGRAPVIHGMLPWNDRVAAEAYRLRLIGDLQRKIVVVLRDKRDKTSQEIRARLCTFYVLPAAPDRGRPEPLRVWTTAAKALSDEEHTAALIAQFRAYAAVMRQRFQGWKEAAEVLEAIDRTLARIDRKKKG